MAQGADAIGSPYASPEEAEAAIETKGIWSRVEGAQNSLEPRFSTANAEYDYNTFKLQAGIDGLLAENESGILIGGVTMHYAHGFANIWSPYDAAGGGGEIKTDGFGFGGTLTWYGENGLYLDGQAQLTWFDSDLSFGGGDQSLVNSNHGFGYALSLESGMRIALDPSWSLTPQAQLVYSAVDFDDFNDVFGARVGLEDSDSLQGRLGLALNHQSSWQNAKGMLDRANVYAIANLYYEFLDGTEVNVAGTSFASKNDRLWGGMGIGGSYDWNDDKYSIFGEGLVKTSMHDFADSYSLEGQLGFRIKW